MRARQENEAAKRKARLEEAALGQDHRTALPDQNIKQRSGASRVSIVIVPRILSLHRRSSTRPPTPWRMELLTVYLVH